MVIMHKNKLEESQFLEMYVTPCPSVWYQNVIFGVLAHGLKLSDNNLAGELVENRSFFNQSQLGKL